MSTTAPAKTDPLAEVEGSRQRLEAARQERAQLGEQQRAWGQGIAEIEAQLRAMAHDDPSQFDASGSPKAKSEAASLRKALEQARASSWPDVLAGGDARVAEAATAYRRAVRDNAITFARLQYERSREGVKHVQALGQELKAALGQVVQPEAELLDIVTSVGPPLNGQDVHHDDLIEMLLEVLGRLDNLQPTRVATLTPFEGEEVRVRRTADGGWLGTQSEPRSGWHPEQPERVPRP